MLPPVRARAGLASEIHRVGLAATARRHAPKAIVHRPNLTAMLAVEFHSPQCARRRGLRPPRSRLLRYTLLAQGLPPWAGLRGVAAPPERFTGHAILCAYSNNTVTWRFSNDKFAGFAGKYSQLKQGRSRQADEAGNAHQAQRRPGCGHRGTGTGAPDRAHRTASEEPGPRAPPAGGNTQRAVAPETTARVRAARRARGGPGNDEAQNTTAEGQQERTAASTPEAQPTRTEPPAERTAEITGATGNGELCREPAKATAPPRGKEEELDVSLLEIMF